MAFSIQKKLVKTLVKKLAKNLVKNLAKNLFKNLIKISNKSKKVAVSNSREIIGINKPFKWASKGFKECQSACSINVCCVSSFVRFFP